MRWPGEGRRPKIRVSPAAERTRRTPMGTVVFDSKAEARRWDALYVAWQAGGIRWIQLQPPFRLPGRTTYRADFLIVWASGEVTVEDVKGHRTPAFIRSKKQVEDIYGLEIVEVDAKSVL